MSASRQKRRCFISYSKGDSESVKVAAYIKKELGAHAFLDINDISATEGLSRQILTGLSEAELVVVLMGPTWCASVASDEPGWVKEELERTPNTSKILLCVVSHDVDACKGVLLGKGWFGRDEQSLRTVDTRRPMWHADADKIIKESQDGVGDPATGPGARRWIAVGAVLALVLGILGVRATRPAGPACDRLSNVTVRLASSPEKFALLEVLADRYSEDRPGCGTIKLTKVNSGDAARELLQAKPGSGKWLDWDAVTFASSAWYSWLFEAMRELRMQGALERVGGTFMTSPIVAVQKRTAGSDTSPFEWRDMLATASGTSFLRTNPEQSTTGFVSTFLLYSAAGERPADERDKILQSLETRTKMYVATTDNVADLLSNPPASIEAEQLVAFLEEQTALQANAKYGNAFQIRYPRDLALHSDHPIYELKVDRDGAAARRLVLERFVDYLRGDKPQAMIRAALFRDRDGRSIDEIEVFGGRQFDPRAFSPPTYDTNLVFETISRDWKEQYARAMDLDLVIIAPPNEWGTIRADLDDAMQISLGAHDRVTLNAYDPQTGSIQQAYSRINFVPCNDAYFTPRFASCKYSGDTRPSYQAIGPDSEPRQPENGRRTRLLVIGSSSVPDYGRFINDALLPDQASIRLGTIGVDLGAQPTSTDAPLPKPPGQTTRYNSIAEEIRNLRAI